MNYYNALLISYFHNDSNQKHVQVHAVSTSLLFDKIKIPLPFDYRILVWSWKKIADTYHLHLLLQIQSLNDKKGLKELMPDNEYICMN